MAQFIARFPVSSRYKMFSKTHHRRYYRYYEDSRCCVVKVKEDRSYSSDRQNCPDEKQDRMAGGSKIDIAVSFIG
jgi:hypothetical protein